MQKNKQLFILCLFLVMGIILNIAPINVSDDVDKLYHFIGFALMTISAISTYIEFFGQKRINLFLLFLLLLGSVVTGLAEFMQKFIEIRPCSFEDWVANMLGIASVSVIVFFYCSKAEKNIENIEDRFDFGDLPAV